MTGSRRYRRRMAMLIFAFLFSAAVLGVLGYRKYVQRGAVSPVPPQTQDAGTIFVTLFFADPATGGLKREMREIDACNDLAACSEEVISELENGPLGDMEPVLPPTFSLKSLQIAGDTVVVDLESGSWSGLPEGSSAEMTAAYAVVNSLVVNFPLIRKVKFLLDGASVDTLKGHLDLREPLAPDFSLEKK